jgi:preprotein translocase subunit SecD
MITAAILYWFGRYSGATTISGFALTLFIGVAVSMFTAITVTRTFLRLLVGHGLVTDSWLFAARDEHIAVPSPSAAD